MNPDEMYKRIEGVVRRILRNIIIYPGMLKEPKQIDKVRGTKLTFYKNGDWYATIIKEKDILDLVAHFEKLHPNRIDDEFIAGALTKSLEQWILQDRDAHNNSDVVALVKQLVSKIESEIFLMTVYVPIVGLRLNISEPISLVGGYLCSNLGESEMKKLIHFQRERSHREYNYESEDKSVKAFFKISYMAHYRRVIREAKERASLALDVLRLYIGSYNDGKKMGVLGTILPISFSELFLVKGTDLSEDARMGSHEYRLDEQKMDYQINHKELNSINSLGLQKIDSHLIAVLLNESQKSFLSYRVFRAIHWYAKGITATSPADSFFSYAISMEALLSENRTLQNNYALWVAALVTRGESNTAFPSNDLIFTPKATSAFIGNTLRIRHFANVQAIAKIFMSERNQIAHGNALATRIQMNKLIIFESLVKNSILSFVMDGWDSVKSFKGSLKKQGVSMIKEVYDLLSILEIEKQTINPNISDAKFHIQRIIVELEHKPHSEPLIKEHWETAVSAVRSIPSLEQIADDIETLLPFL